MVETTDVLVLGSGAGGLSAALTASVGGAQLTVLEAAPVFGGTTAISGGGMWLPGNTLDPDYTESLEDAKTYLKKLTLGLVSDEVIDRFLAEAGTVPTFFSEHTALEFKADIGRPDYFAPWEGSSLTSRTVFPAPYELPRLGEMADKVRKPGAGGILPIQHEEERRYGTRPDGDHQNELDLDSINKLIEDRLARNVVLRGRALVGGLMEGCLERGVQFVSDTRGRKLIVEDGRVVGVRAERHGEEVEYRARYGVVIASGGFEWNRELWDRFLGVPYDGPATPPYNRGDGLIMASEAGAKLGNLDKATWCPSSYLGEQYDSHPFMQGRASGQHTGEILVNRKGRRFVNETLPYNDIGRVFTRFDPQTYEWENHPCFMIGDRHSLAALESPPVTAYAYTNDPDRPTYTSDSGDGWVSGNTIREVAEKLGIDADGLEQQIAEWNEHAVDGVDPVFHRAERPWEVHNLPNHASIGPIVEGPFVGHRVRASVFGTRGGPMINENAQIVNYSDERIPGLYGAGNAIAHPFAHVYPGGGGTLGPAVTFGHIAGKSVLEDNGVQAPSARGVLEGAAS